jgi:ssDNA-binding Zn-finger/Zn-ribbon topoisomerase 1
MSAPLALSGDTCPKCGSKMVGRYVKRTGRPYWGCSRYPACKGKREIERKSNVLGDPEDADG